MREKFIFELSDFEGGGQMVVRQTASRDCQDVSFLASVSYKVGWASAGAGKNLAILVSLTDGMCCRFASLDLLVKHLNKDAAGYRPMTKTEITQVMSYVGNRFPLHGEI